jgi:hypothetical protein
MNATWRQAVALSYRRFPFNINVVGEVVLAPTLIALANFQSATFRGALSGKRNLRRVSHTVRINRCALTGFCRGDQKAWNSSMT